LWTGTAPIRYAYQWQRDGADISAATGSTYALSAGDVGDQVDVIVTASNTVGSNSATSSVTATVASSTSPGEDPTPSEEPSSPVTSPLLSETWEGFSAANPMPAGRTPGNSSSPFNQPVGPTPQVLPNSAAMVTWLLSHIESGEQPIKTIERPKGEPLPMVYASNSDPVVELVGSGGNVNGRRIRVPANAHVGETSDKHITIVLAPSDAKVPGETIDLWLANSEGIGGPLKIEDGKLSYTNGATGNITGNLVEQGDSVSSNWAAEAGVIRGPELKAGIVLHALAAAVKDTKQGPGVYPATGGDGENTEAASPATGQRFYLDYTDAEIESLGFKPWKTAVLKALARYGFYIEDTGNSTTSFRWEGKLMYEPFGAPEPFTKIGEEQGVEKSGSEYVFNLAQGVDWKRLRAIAPPPA